MNEEKKSFRELAKHYLGETSSWTFISSMMDTVPNFSEKDITPEFLEYMIKEGLRERSQNTVRVYMTRFKTVINRARSRGFEIPVTSDEINAVTRLSKQASQQVWLTNEELYRIAEYKPRSEEEDFTQALFLLLAFTGSRISDYPFLNETAIVDNSITFVSTKTKHISRVPLHFMVPELMERVLVYNYSIPTATTYVSRTIKQICKAVGIDEILSGFRHGRRWTRPKYEFVSAHTARRSFATNLYIDGYTELQIMKMLGHTDIRQSVNYILAEHDDEVTGAKMFFKDPSKFITQNYKEQKIYNVLRDEGFAPEDIDKIVVAFSDFNHDKL